MPADPESKGGVEATVKIAKADLVPTDANLLDNYASWAELVDACDRLMADVNGRKHQATRRRPVEMLVEEQQRLHRLPERPYTTVFGETRRVSWPATISYGRVTYSVPHTLADETVWVRVDGDQIDVTHCPLSGPVEVARHRRSPPGHPMISDAHYPPRPAGPLNRQPKPTSSAEAEFVALGERPAVADRGFDELMPKTIANATVDRLLHHAHVVLTTGDSIRLTQATAGRG